MRRARRRRSAKISCNYRTISTPTPGHHELDARAIALLFAPTVIAVVTASALVTQIGGVLDLVGKTAAKARVYRALRSTTRPRRSNSQARFKIQMRGFLSGGKRL